MQIVVTGAKGFLGQRVVECLAQRDHTIVAIDRIDPQVTHDKNVIYHQADITDPQALLPSVPFPPSPLSPFTPFTLLHLAWDMRRHLGYGVQAEQVRVAASMLEAWQDKGLARVVIMGSAEEYGSREGRIREEDPPVGVLSPYGWGKRALHDLAQSWSSRSGIPVTWLRPFIVYGPGQRGDMMIPYAVRCAREGVDAEFTDGTQKRDFVHVKDVAAGIAAAATVETSGFQAFNLGRGEPVEVRKVLMEIARGFDAEDRFHLGARSRRPGEPEVQVADTTRATSDLKWSARIGWQEGIRSVIGAP